MSTDADPGRHLNENSQSIRHTTRFDREQYRAINALVEAGEYHNVSEAIRQLIDDGLRGDRA